MQLTDLQQRAVDLVLRGNERIVLIEGYAGTGKTQILAAIAGQKDCPILTPTNKAAQVLRQRGVIRAQTLHSYLYSPIENDEYERDRDGNIKFTTNEDGERVALVKASSVGFNFRETGEKAPLALIDEGSMVGEEELDDCLAAFERVVVFRDPFQLPPVLKTMALEDKEPDIFLDEVHRAAWDNPITRFATAIRRHERLDWTGIERMRSTDPAITNHLVAEQGYQALCWTNGLRHTVNDEVRLAMGYEGPPRKGESLVCRENLYRHDGLALYNGQLVTPLYDVEDTDHHLEPAQLFLQERGDEEYFLTWPFWKEKYRRATAAQIKNYIRSKSRLWTKGRRFDFAYCLTAHTAQGSEWDNVIVFDQRNIMRSDADRWFYTAVTRAKQNLVVAA